MNYCSASINRQQRPWTTRPRSSEHGVTLVELVVVLTIMGVVASIGATLVGRIVSGQQENRGRLVLALSADAAVATVADDMARALPNSLRLTSNAAGVWIETVPVLDAGRYRTAPDTVAGSPGDPMDTTDAADNSFDIIGEPINTALAGRAVVFHNLGTPESDVYSGNNRRSSIVLTAGGSHLSFTAGAALPAAPAQPRFFVVDTPVTLACVLQADGRYELRRYANYGWQASQPTSVAALATGSNRLQLGGLLGCSAAYNTALANIGLLNLRLSAGTVGSGARMHLLHQLPVDNTP